MIAFLFGIGLSEVVASYRYLAKGGAILPDKANMYICGIEDADYKEERIEFWENVYGFNMFDISEIPFFVLSDTSETVCVD